MTGAQIAALIVGSMMFLPGLCFFAFGIGMFDQDGSTLLAIGVAILLAVFFLGRFAFRKPPSPPPS